MNVSQWILAHFYQIAGYFLAIILVPRILIERRHPGATVAWLLIIGLFPFVGVPVYFLIGGRRVQKISKKKDWHATVESFGALPFIDYELPPNNRKIADLLINAGMFSPSADNKVNIIDDGITAYNDLVNLIENATRSIEISTFILGRDDVGRALVEILSRKAREGVKVRLLLDALGCFRTKGKFVQPIKNDGGQVAVFFPLLPLRRRWSANLRNHRKMAIVDGNSAMIGGMNLAQEYMGPDPYIKRWKDVCMVVSGKSAEHIRNVFIQDWVYSTEKTFDHNMLPPSSFQGGGGNSIIQVVGDGPDVPERPLYSGILAALHQAQESIFVVTPYFVPDDPITASLELAARMGCDVRLIIPEHSNHPLVDLAGRSFLSELMDAGVKFYCYQPGMLHAKLISIDKEMAVVGSANMDMRSFYLNFEIATFLYSPQDVGEVSKVMESILGNSRRITRIEIVQKSNIRKFSEDICRVFSPLL